MPAPSKQNKKKPGNNKTVTTLKQKGRNKHNKEMKQTNGQ
jgi:hypothetical protein